MAKGRFFCAGDLCVDVLYSGGQKKAGEERKLSTLNFSIGGNAANTAVMASKLGLRPVLFSVIGNDFAKPFLLKELKDAGVRLELIESKKLNSYSVIEVLPNGERAIQSAKNCLGDLTVKKIQSRLLKKIRPGDIIFFGGFYHLKNFRKGFRQLLSKICSKGATTCFDTCFDTFGKWNIKPFLGKIDFLFTNEVELKHISNGASMKARAGSLLGFRPLAVVVKQGPKGATLFLQGDSIHSSARRVKVVNTTAAGDSFNAGFVFGLLNNYTLGGCMRAGTAVAAKKIQHHGLVAPHKREVERFALQK